MERVAPGRGAAGELKLRGTIAIADRGLDQVSQLVGAVLADQVEVRGSGSKK